MPEVPDSLATRRVVAAPEYRRQQRAMLHSSAKSGGGMHPPALLPPTFSPDGENRTESEKEDVVDKLLDMYSSTGKQTVLTTLADVHEWAANTITELEADIVTRRLDYTEDCKRLDARIEELELRIADESRACALFQSHIRELEAALTAAQERGRTLNDELYYACELAIAYAHSEKDKEWAAERIEELMPPEQED